MEYDAGQYGVTPCGAMMSGCNDAFIDLANRMEDVLSSSFDVVPRGDKHRMRAVGDGLMRLMQGSFYALTWVNAMYYKKTHPNDHITDLNRLA